MIEKKLMSSTKNNNYETKINHKIENIKIIHDHLTRINKKLDEGNNRSLENHIALQSPNEIKCFTQIKETIVKTYLLIEQDAKNERIKAIQSDALTFIKNKISSLLEEKNELDAILYTNLYQALVNCDTNAVLKLFQVLKNENISEEQFDLDIDEKNDDEI